MKRYTVDVTRGERWWVMHARVPRSTIWSQTRDIDSIEPMIREAIALALDLDADTFEIELRFQLGADIDDQVARARSAATTAAVAQETASRETRMAARALRRQGLTVKETGYFLGVSPQRVSQLLNG